MAASCCRGNRTRQIALLLSVKTLEPSTPVCGLSTSPHALPNPLHRFYKLYVFLFAVVGTPDYACPAVHSWCAKCLRKMHCQEQPIRHAGRAHVT